MHTYETYVIDDTLGELEDQIHDSIESGTAPDYLTPTHNENGPDHYLELTVTRATDTHVARFQTYPKHAPDSLADRIDEWASNNQAKIEDGDFDTPRWELLVTVTADGGVTDLEFVATVGWK